MAAPIFKSILVISSVINIINSENCTYGDFQINNETCMFNCWQQTSISLSSVPFTAIKNRCSNVNIAANKLGCTINDLVWPSDSCGCPYCKCSLDSEDFYELYSYSDDGPERFCYKCECSASSDSGITDLVISCHQWIDADEVNEWQDFKCPPTACLDSDGNPKTMWSDWWEDVADGLDCDKFCFCSADQGTICATGYANIMANDKLLNAFRSDCGDSFYMRGV